MLTKEEIRELEEIREAIAAIVAACVASPPKANGGYFCYRCRDIFKLNQTFR